MPRIRTPAHNLDSSFGTVFPCRSCSHWKFVLGPLPMCPVFPLGCSICSIYPSFPQIEVGFGVRVEPLGSVIDDRLMRVLSVKSVTTLRQALLRRPRTPIAPTCKYCLYVRHASTLVMSEPALQQQPTIEVPPGFTLHSENTTHILLPGDNGAFLNPVQEFNRDLSVACIRVWSEEWNRAKEVKWRAVQEKKAKKPEKRLKGVPNSRTHHAAAVYHSSGCCDRLGGSGRVN